MLTAILGALGAILIFVSGVVGYYLREIQHRREMSVKMIELAVNVLSAKPDPNTVALRDWAVDILANFAPPAVPLNDAAKAALRNKPLPVFADAAGRAVGRSWARGAGAVGTAGDLSETPVSLREEAKRKTPINQR